MQEIELGKVLDGSQPGSVIVLHVAQSAQQRAQLQAQHEAQKARHLLVHHLRHQAQMQAHLAPGQLGASPSYFNKGWASGAASATDFGPFKKDYSFGHSSASGVK